MYPAWIERFWSSFNTLAPDQLLTLLLILLVLALVMTLVAVRPAFHLYSEYREMDGDILKQEREHDE